MLGYGIDHCDSAPVRAPGRRPYGSRLRSERMTARLGQLGLEVDERPLAARRAAGKPIGRPHLAAAVVAHPANVERLREEGHDEVSAFIAAYLIPGAPAYVGRTKPTIGEAIAWIHEAGVAVWAHPFWDIKDEHTVLGAIDRFREAGLDGVECFYVTHGAHQTQLLADRCAELGLITTASSDYHGPGHRMFDRFLAYALYERSRGSMACFLRPRIRPAARLGPKAEGRRRDGSRGRRVSQRAARAS